MSDIRDDKPLSPEELDEVLALAKAEGWTELALLGPRTDADWYRWRLREEGWNEPRIFVLSQQLETVPAPLLEWRHLTALALPDNWIGAKGANALSRASDLSSLAKLNLPGNRIGVEGAEALSRAAHLSNLTALDLWDNGVGARGATALFGAAQLSRLTRLSLGGNGIGERGAEALQCAQHLLNLEELYLSGNGIGEKGAQALARAHQLSNLKTLFIGGNDIGMLGAEALGRAAHLCNLTTLDLGDNRIGAKGAAAVVGATRLSNLTSLNLGYNYIGEEGAEALACLTHLCDLNTLNLDGNRIGDKGATALAGASRLSHLTSLSLGQNGIGDKGAQALAGAAHLSHLTVLELYINDIGDKGCAALVASVHLSELNALDLRSNRIGDRGAEALASAEHLSHLRTLCLGGNGIGEKGVAAIAGAAHLANLDLLELSYNGLKSLPPAFASFRQLRRFILTGNPLPKEILDLAERQDLSDLRAYLAGLVGAREHFECKLVFVGAGQMGKSCLLEGLRGERPVEGRKSTKGIEIARVPLTLDHPSRADTKLVLNCWDMGGQETYEVTHQFFFSPRSIYLLLWSPRLGADACRLEEWLRLIQHRVGHEARVILVATYAKTGRDTLPDVVLDDLRAKFGEDVIVGLHRVDNLVPDEGEPESPFGVPELKRAIAEVAATMPERFPNAMRAARDKIIEAARGDQTWMRFSDFVALAVSAGVDRAELLATVLDIQGHVVYHPPEEAKDPIDPPRTHGVVLQPEWLAKAIAILLDDPVNREAKGIVPHVRTRELWAAAAYPEEVHAYFRGLMERCYVSYRIPDRAESLLPQLLVGERPGDLPWTPEDAVQEGRPQLLAILDFYEVPRGLVPVLIVATHKYRVKTSWHWPRGTFLKDTQSDAEAFVELRARDLVVAVRGSDPGRFMQALLRLIDGTVTDVWEGIRLDDKRGVTTYVPCYEKARRGEACEGRERLRFLQQELMKSRDGKRTCSECGNEREITRLLHGFYFEDRRISDQVEGLRQNLERHEKLSQGRAKSLLDAQLTARKDAPYLFTLLPRDSKDPVNNRFDLTLWCEGYGERKMHPVCPIGSRGSGDYLIKRPRAWLKRAAPGITWTLRLCKYIVPVAGEAFKQAADDLGISDWKGRIALAEKMVGILPSGELELGATTPIDPNLPVEPDEAAVRVFHQLLESDVKNRDWGGLAPVRVMGMGFRWLCPKCSAAASKAKAVADAR